MSQYGSKRLPKRNTFNPESQHVCGEKVEAATQSHYDT